MRRPWTIIHCIMSVDGRLTTARGLRTRWELIAPEALDEYYRLSRHLGVQAIMTSSPHIGVAEQIMRGRELTASTPGNFSPTLVTLDNYGHINWTLLKRMPWFGSVIVLCSERTPSHYLRYLQEEKIDYVIAGEQQIDIELALQILWEQHKVSLLACLGGGSLNGELLRKGLADELSLVIAPLAVGGTTTPTVFDAPDLQRVEDITHLKLVHMLGLSGGAIWLRYEISHELDNR